VTWVPSSAPSSRLTTASVVAERLSGQYNRQMTTNLTTREKLHQLIDQLPESELAMTECLLQDLVNGTRDPLLWKLMSAPWDDEPETEEERATVQEARE
jgi:hypothetical protein